MNDECQHFGNMIAAKLRNFSHTVRFVIQNKIMIVFLNENRGFYERYHHTRGTAVSQWLRCCATNPKVAGSIPASVSGFFIDITFFR